MVEGLYGATRMKIGESKVAEPTRHVGMIHAGEARSARRRITALPDHDAVRVSELGRVFARLLGRIDDSAPDPARAAQVEILRNAVATGRYAPDLHAVARKLLVEFAAERVR